MKAVFLDFATMGKDHLDPSPLIAVLPDLQIYDDTADDLRAERTRDAEIVLANKVRLDREILEQAKALRFIGLTATGVDNVDLAIAAEHKIAVCNIRAYCTQSVVEHVFAVLLNLTHSIIPHRDTVRSGAWQNAQEFCMLDHPIRELSAMTMGIVGYGELGRGVVTTARHFGMSVLIARRRGADVRSDDGRTDFDDLLVRSDVISLHCPLTDATRNLFGAGEFRKVKSDAILINTARGALIDSAALVDALTSAQIAAAAIDVLPQEPPVTGNPLLDYSGDNLILTPHIAWATREARQNAINELAANVRAFLDGEIRCRIV